MTKEEILKELDPSIYIGRSVSQVEEFLQDAVRPVLERYPSEVASKLNV